MADNVREISEQSKPTADKLELRLRSLKDRQNEERQKKLEEIKAQALAAQRFKEQKEQERRKRIEELKGKDDVRRQQVEERKRAIMQAEQDRLISILKRNQEREARIEAKRRNEKSNIVFAFGSSTPRMLDPNDVTSSFWGTRRATSIQNITSVAANANSSLTRRQSERDLDSGSKKRATSASGLERSGESSIPLVPAGCVSGYVGRRRTDLMPTIPSKDSSFSTTPRKSLNHSPASSRPSSSLSQQSTTSVTSSVSVKHRSSTARRQRPASIAITGITHDIKPIEKKTELTKPPLPKTRKSISKDNKLIKNKTSPVDTTPKNIISPVSASVPITTITTTTTTTIINNNKTSDQKDETPPSIIENKETNQDDSMEKSKEISQNNIVNDENSETTNIMSNFTKDMVQAVQEFIETESRYGEITTEITTTTTNEIKESNDTSMQSSGVQSSEIKDNNEMTTSITKPRITTEEEAKAALAERRRLAREEAERQAEQERLRLEAEAQAELERQRLEEEQVQKLLEQQRIAEQQRLEEAIKETKRREEEERLRKEEELRTKLLKEEAERKAREEAERKFAEQQERLKNEEKEREARRKRVEAIMRRTRGVNANNTQTQQNSDDKNENKSDNKMNGTNKQMEQENVTKNGKDLEIVDNIIPDDTIKNANTVSIDTITSTDSINSNNTWQTTQQYGNFGCNDNNNHNNN